MSACGVCVLLCLHGHIHSVMVLGAGRVLEYAPPAELLANSSSVFYSMARDAGLVASKDASLVLSENASEDPGLVTSKDAGLVTSKDAGLFP